MFREVHPRNLCDQAPAYVTFPVGSTLPDRARKIAEILLVVNVFVRDGDEQSFGRKSRQHLRQELEAAPNVQDEAGPLQDFPEHGDQVNSSGAYGFERHLQPCDAGNIQYVPVVFAPRRMQVEKDMLSQMPNKFGIVAHEDVAIHFRRAHTHDIFLDRYGLTRRPVTKNVTIAPQFGLDRRVVHVESLDK